MNTIIELCDLASPMKIRHLKLLEDDSDQPGQLYQLIKEGKIKTDDDAIDHFFQDNKHAKTYLKGIKEKLFHRLINTVLFLNQNQERDYIKAYYDAYRLFVTFKILSGARKRMASLEVAKKGLKVTQKYHFTELTLSFARELKLLYSSILPNRTKYEKYSRITAETSTALQIEIEAEDLMSSLTIIATRKQYGTKELKTIAALAERASQIIEMTDAYWPLFLCGNTIVIKHQIFKEYVQTTLACQKMLQKLNNLPYSAPKSAIFTFTFTMIPGHIINKDFEQADLILKECLTMMQQGSINWIKAMQLKVLLEFHRKNYEEGFKIAVKINQNYQKIIRDKENWEIIEAYGRILTNQKLRLQRLLNEVPEYSKDKRGMNINILIIRSLEYIRRKEFGRVIDNTAALNQYAYRYLRQDETYRSNCFTRMLLSLEKGHFNQIGVERHSSKFFEKLKEMPLHESKQDYEVEIVPYEDLWEFILNQLPKKA